MTEDTNTKRRLWPEVSHRGGMTYSLGEMQRMGWELSLELG